jgi:hypothetical protein
MLTSMGSQWKDLVPLTESDYAKGMSEITSQLKMISLKLFEQEEHQITIEKALYSSSASSPPIMSYRKGPLCCFNCQAAGHSCYECI